MAESMAEKLLSGRGLSQLENERETGPPKYNLNN